MAQYIYNFTKFANGVIRPLVNVKITNPATNKSLNVKCLLDTGADKCLFPADFASMTDHDLLNEQCLFENSSGINGTEVKTALHTFRIELFTEDLRTRIWRSNDIQVGCLEHNAAPPLLGYTDFLEFMNIRFNYVTKKIVLEI